MMLVRVIGVLLILLMFSCSQNKPEQLPYKLVFDQEYRLTHIGSRHVSAEKAPMIVFKEGDKITGNSGCNSYLSSYKLEKNSITIQPPATTMMACFGDVMQQEITYIQMLPTMIRYEIDKERRLVLYPASGKLLAFTPILKNVKDK